MLSPKTILATLFLTAVPLSASAQEHDAQNHEMGAVTTTQPAEPGQGAFAAIAEIVALLSADPTTDWSRVNIGALRAHLVDMNQLTINAAVETNISDTEVQFRVSGTDGTLRAIRAMVPAHARELSSATDWVANAELTETGALLVLSSEDAEEVSKISALGFFGVMATGAHHQEHHLMIASGIDAH